MINNDTNYFVYLLMSFKDVLLGLIGGLVGYLIKYSREKNSDPEHKLSIIFMLINILLGGYAAYMFGTLIPKDASWRDFALGVIGVSSYPIMMFIESNGFNIVIKKMSTILKIDLEESINHPQDKKK